MPVNQRSGREDDTPRAARVRRRQLQRRAPLLCCAVLAATAAKPALGGYTFNTIATFNGANGANPDFGVTPDSAGNLYGLTNTGGMNGGGTIYEIAAGSHALTTLANFGINYGPDSALVADSAGNLYGSAGGGTTGYGAVFQLSVEQRRNDL
jgi:uncharacterized repeat protein (TIGR03803 family)